MESAFKFTGILLIVAIIFTLFAIALGPATAQVLQVIMRPHAEEKHGTEAAMAVSAMFAEHTGRCSEGPSMELYSQKVDAWMYLCFINGGASAWIMKQRITDPDSLDITRIPRDQISKPINYFKSVLQRDGYLPKTIFGEIPDWFVNVLSTVIH